MSAIHPTLDRIDSLPEPPPFELALLAFPEFVFFSNGGGTSVTVSFLSKSNGNNIGVPFWGKGIRQIDDGAIIA